MDKSITFSQALERMHLEFTYTKPPNYIQKLAGTNDEILLIHKGKEEVPSFVQQKYLTELEADFCDLDITGDPLTAPFGNEDDAKYEAIINEDLGGGIAELKRNELYYPVTLQQARTVMSFYNLCEEDELFKKKCECWVIVDSANSSNISLLSTSQITVSEHKCFRSCMSLACKSVKLEDISIDRMLKTHNEMTDQIETDAIVSCVYTVYGTSEDVGDVALHLTWSQKTLQVPMTASTEVCVQVEPGQNKSLQVLRKQVNTVRMYLNTLTERGNSSEAVVVPVQLPRHDTHKPRNLLTDEMKNLLESTDHVGHLKKIKTISSIQNSMSVSDAIKEAGEGKYCQDFVDMMWNVCICSEDYQTLIVLFEQIFHAVTYNDIKLFIHDPNLTQTGSILKKLETNVDLNPPRLHSCDTLALELILEVGLEKLMKDVLAICSNSLGCKEILNPPQSQKSRKPKLEETIADFEKKLKWLDSSMVALEVLTALTQTLDLPQTEVQEIAKNVTVNCTQNQDTQEKIQFKCPVKTQHVLKYLEGSFLECRVQLSSQSARKRTKSVYFFSSLPLFPSSFNTPSSHSSNDLDISQVLNEVGVVYDHTIMLTIDTFLF